MQGYHIKWRTVICCKKCVALQQKGTKCHRGQNGDFCLIKLLLFSTIMLQNQGQLMKQQNTPFCPLWCFVPLCSGTTQIRFQEGLATDRYTAADNETDPQPASCTSHSSTAEFLGGHEQLTWVLELAHSITWHSITMTTCPEGRSTRPNTA